MWSAIQNFYNWLEQPCVTANGTTWLHTNHAGAIFIGLVLIGIITICFSKKLRNVFF